MSHRIILLFSTLLLFLTNISHAQTGRFEITTTSAEVLGEELASTYGELLDTDEKIKWTIYIPVNYDPSAPPGILIHMTDNNMAKIPFGWKSVMDEKNLIFISLNKAGKLIQNKEILLTVLAAPFIENNYQINSNRIYISAQANSCYPASAAMQIYPTIFKGIIYSTCEPINWKSDIPETIDVMKQNRYIFISSNEASVKRAMRRSVRKYKDAGLPNIEYLNIPKLVYGRSIDRRKFMQVIDLLDQRD